MEETHLFARTEGLFLLTLVAMGFVMIHVAIRQGFVAVRIVETVATRLQECVLPRKQRRRLYQLEWIPRRGGRRDQRSSPFIANEDVVRLRCELRSVRGGSCCCVLEGSTVAGTTIVDWARHQREYFRVRARRVG